MTIVTTLRRTILTLSAAAPLLLLSACDGYEMRLYDGFPYGNARTAGHGVEYVLAKMMPKKGPVLEPVAEAPPPVVTPEPEIAPPPPPPPEPMKQADEILEKKARK
jgi:hypothetical protein